MENQRIKQALSDKSKYTYENGVLINKLDIQDQKELDEVEASLTYLRLTNLSMQELKFSFDLNYYLAIHKYIFQDIYSFAGEIKDENISKGGIPFCRPEYVAIRMKETLADLRKKIIKVTTKEEYIKLLAYFYGEINAIHPFREGNGRTLREYLRQLVEVLNNYLPLPAYELDYSAVTEQMRYNLIQGSKDSASKFDYSLLELFFTDVLKEKQIENPTMNK